MFNKYKYLIISVFLIVTIFITFLIPRVNINYNALEYLPDDSNTKIAYEVLKTEFGDNGTLYILVDKVNEDDVLQIKTKLLVNGVKNIDYAIKDDKVLYNVVLNNGDYSKEANLVIEEVITILDGEDYLYYLNGQSYLTYLFNKTINKQMIKIIAMLFPLIILILFLTSRSYFEPILFITVIGISVLLNMGTNALLSSVSYMTHSIAAVIQLAVCMDYSIMLLHSYQNTKANELNANKAMTIAWKSSFIPIIASALTTIAGFVAIMFMRYKIGFDIGIVLVKGVVLSLITVLVLLPCLILAFDKLIFKTMHKSWLIKNKKPKIFPNKFRYIAPLLAVIIIICGFIVQKNNKFLYSDNTTTREMTEIAASNKIIEETFGHNSQGVLLINKDISTKSLIDKLENVMVDDVSYLTSIYGLDKKLTAPEFYNLVKDYQITIDDINLLFKFMQTDAISLNELQALLPTLKKAMTKEEMHAFINRFIEVDISNISFIYQLKQLDELSIYDLITVFDQDFDKEDLKQVFNENDLQQMLLILDKDKVKLIEVLNYFDSIFNTSYDKGTLLMVLNFIPQDYIDFIFEESQDDSFTYIEIVNILLLEYSENKMRILLSDFDEDLIHSIYQEMENNKLLNDKKVTIKAFALFILSNYQTIISDEEKLALESIVNNMMALENVNNKVNLISSSKKMINEFSQIKFENILLLYNIDTNLITQEFIGNNYQRIILNINLPEESDLAFNYYTKLVEEIKNNVEDFYFISRTTSVLEIKNTSQNNNLLVSLLSIGMIFMIIMFSFKSLTIPIILVLLIQGAIYVNMSIPAMMGEEIIFIGYVIVSSIQLGATIDYAILTTSRYTTNRKSYNKSESLYKAINESKPSVITSGLILTCAGLALAFFSGIPVIRSMGRLIGIGGAISMVMVLFLLPQILFVTDKVIIKKNK